MKCHLLPGFGLVLLVVGIGWIRPPRSECEGAQTGCAMLSEFIVKHPLVGIINFSPLDQMLRKCVHESHLFCSLIYSVPGM